MKNLGPLTFKVAALTLAAGMFVVGQRPVHAQSEGEALVLHGCPDSITEIGHTQGYAYDVCADITFTPSGNVNATFHGALLDPSTAPTHTIVARDFPCEYNGVISHDSQVVITPDGNVEGNCDIHP